MSGMKETGGKEKTPKEPITWIEVPGHMVKNYMTVIRRMERYLKVSGIYVYAAVEIERADHSVSSILL